MQTVVLNAAGPHVRVKVKNPHPAKVKVFTTSKVVSLNLGTETDLKFVS